MNEELTISFSFAGNECGIFDCITREDLEKYNGETLEEKAVSFLKSFEFKIKTIYEFEGETLFDGESL